MRVYFLLSEDHLFKAAMLDRVLRERSACVVGVGVVGSPPGWRRGSPWRRFLRLTHFWGASGVLALVRLVLAKRLFRAFAPRACRLPISIKDAARGFGIPTEDVSDVNASDFLCRLRRANVEVLFSFQHQILGEEALSVPSVAAINCHPASLPQFRGVKPIFWAMLEGSQEIGVTVHSMTPEIDAGRIVVQRSFLRRPNDSLLENYDAAFAVAASAIIESLDRIDTGFDWEAAPEIPVAAPYFKAPKTEDIKRFRRAGGKMS
jgi:Formyl transferase